jgi:hypothetical protein
MNELEIIKKLAAAAAPGPVSVDVTGRVLAGIASRKPERPNGVFAACAAVAVAAALAVCLLAAFSGPQNGNPIADVMQTLTTVVQ